MGERYFVFTNRATALIYEWLRRNRTAEVQEIQHKAMSDIMLNPETQAEKLIDPAWLKSDSVKVWETAQQMAELLESLLESEIGYEQSEIEFEIGNREQPLTLLALYALSEIDFVALAEALIRDVEPLPPAYSDLPTPEIE